MSDVVGYSRLTGADEDRILARLRTLRSDLIDPTIAVHHGRIVKRTGDGSIIEFRSVVDAVRCAIEIQTGLIERNAGLPPEKRIEFRVGIHVGDVVEESDGDLMGDGVNIASRLEGIAKPGAICLSEQPTGKSRDGSRWRSAISARPNSRTSPSRSMSIRWRSVRRPRPSPPDRRSPRSSRRAGRARRAQARGLGVGPVSSSPWPRCYFWPQLAAGISSVAAKRSPRRPCIFRSLSCHSPICRAIRRRIISPTGSPRTSPRNSHASATVS